MQEILTYIIISYAFGYVSYKTYLTFKRKPVCEEEYPTCTGCHLKKTCSISKVSTSCPKT